MSNPFANSSTAANLRILANSIERSVAGDDDVYVPDFVFVMIDQDGLVSHIHRGQEDMMALIGALEIRKMRMIDDIESTMDE